MSLDISSLTYQDPDAKSFILKVSKEINFPNPYAIDFLLWKDKIHRECPVGLILADFVVGEYRQIQKSIPSRKNQYFHREFDLSEPNLEIIYQSIFPRELIDGEEIERIGFRLELLGFDILGFRNKYSNKEIVYVSPGLITRR